MARITEEQIKKIRNILIDEGQRNSLKYGFILDNHYIGYVECMTGWCRRWRRIRNRKVRTRNDC